MGFKSGEYGGHSINSTLLWRRNALIELAVWHGALSCIRRQVPGIAVWALLNSGINSSLSIEMYSTWFIDPWIETNGPVPCFEKQPQNITEFPPLCILTCTGASAWFVQTDIRLLLGWDATRVSSVQMTFPRLQAINLSSIIDYPRWKSWIHLPAVVKSSNWPYWFPNYRRNGARSDPIRIRFNYHLFFIIWDWFLLGAHYFKKKKIGHIFQLLYWVWKWSPTPIKFTE